MNRNQNEEVYKATLEYIVQFVTSVLRDAESKKGRKKKLENSHRD